MLEPDNYYQIDLEEYDFDQLKIDFDFSSLDGVGSEELEFEDFDFDQLQTDNKENNISNKVS